MVNIRITRDGIVYRAEIVSHSLSGQGFTPEEASDRLLLTHRKAMNVRIEDTTETGGKTFSHPTERD